MSLLSKCRFFMNLEPGPLASSTIATGLTHEPMCEREYAQSTLDWLSNHIVKATKSRSLHIARLLLDTSLECGISLDQFYYHGHQFILAIEELASYSVQRGDSHYLRTMIASGLYPTSNMTALIHSLLHTTILHHSLDNLELFLKLGIIHLAPRNKLANMLVLDMPTSVQKENESTLNAFLSIGGWNSGTGINELIPDTSTTAESESSKKFRSAKADTGEDFLSSRMKTVSRGYESVMCALLDVDNSIVDIKNSTDQTVIKLAARGSNVTFVRMLLRTGKIDVDSKMQGVERRRVILQFTIRAGFPEAENSLTKLSHISLIDSGKRKDTNRTTAMLRRKGIMVELLAGLNGRSIDIDANELSEALYYTLHIDNP